MPEAKNALPKPEKTSAFLEAVRTTVEVSCAYAEQHVTVSNASGQTAAMK